MWQPIHLHDDKVLLTPLKPEDFGRLYAVASDPLIWEQHPNPDRYKREVFENYFKGAIESEGALLIQNAQTEEVVGCSRFYDHEPENSVVKIGYTFFGRSAWGKGYNQASKKLMLDHAFDYVDAVIFHVGEKNMRSRIAMTRLGAELIGLEEVAYYGESSRMNCVFQIRKPDGNSSPKE
jgi:RimJ/RimL family protein N-acetyltransferase